MAKFKPGDRVTIKPHPDKLFLSYGLPFDGEKSPLSGRVETVDRFFEGVQGQSYKVHIIGEGDGWYVLEAMMEPFDG